MDSSQLSPMIQHYMEIEKERPDCVLSYRLGDFYEMLLDDALAVSKELEIILAGKNYGLSKRAPMCRVPLHALDSYLYHLVQKGYKVAITEQMEDLRQTKDLVKCEVIRVVTPGTITSSRVLNEAKNNYLMGIIYMDGIYGISTAGISTGDFMAIGVDSGRGLSGEINKFFPSEIICDNAFYVSDMDMDELKNRYWVVISALDSRSFGEESYRRIPVKHFKVRALVGLGLEDYATGVIATGAVMQYIYETQKSTLEHITIITPYSTGQYTVTDTSTRRNLGLAETMQEKRERGTLPRVLDKTKTVMGAKLLRVYIEQPLIHRDEVIKHQSAAEELNMNYTSQEEICEYLNPIHDLERLIGRISYKTTSPRDLIAFRSSLEILPYIKRILGEFNSELLTELGRELDPLQDIFQLTGDTIAEESSITVREGGIIKDGYNQEVDKLRHAKTKGKNRLVELKAKGKEKIGIRTLKVKPNKVFDYHFEVINSFENQVPDCYIHKQTLTDAERFATDELKQLEDIIMDAEGKPISLEYNLFCEVRDKIGVGIIRIQKAAKSIAGIDVFCPLSVMVTRRNYAKPFISNEDVTQIRNGCYPVMEQMVRDDMFMANNTSLDNGKNRLSVITDPNMAGESTYVRQVAPIILMTQLGSSVPAQEADVGICGRIFTRVGTSDDLASGQSTFMVEMTGVANILRNTIRSSFLVLDEVGRGANTFDGLSIARAVIKHISNSKLLGTETLFATHYHELTELEGTIVGMKNYCIAIKEQKDDIVFLCKIVRSGADRSYGIQAVKLTSVSDSAIARAKEIVEELSDVDIMIRTKEITEISSNITQHKAMPKPGEVDLRQLPFFDTVKDDDIIHGLDSPELSAITPLDAMNTLYRPQTKLKSCWKETG